MVIDIFLKSYVKDADWAWYCIQSIKKYCSGYRRIIVSIPSRDRHAFARIEKQVEIVEENPVCEGYVDQQLKKLNADIHTNADYILYIDSDCFFTAPFNFNEMLDEEGRPYILMTSYQELGNSVPWKPIVERDAKITAYFEYMRRMPLMYHTNSITRFRKWFYDTHAQTHISEYLRFVPHRSFSEFNILGLYCHNFEKERYVFQNTADNNYKAIPCIQRWSWGGISEDTRKQMEELLK